ncbi:MAG: ATP-binding protein [Microscillaceae bacterium]|nr:ATP-binding protein [Microscillaceae bacterium]
MTHHFKVNCLRDNLKLIREFVQTVLTEYPLSEIETNQLILAVDEVCSNLIIHAHDCNPDINIEINILGSEELILFEIIHKNTDNFDFSQYKNPSLKKIVQERRKGGIGLILVNKIMDNVEVKNENTFNIWRMSKYINAG